MNAAVAQKPYEVPEGGLASFLTATTGDWADDALTGLDYDVIFPAANQLAEFGREGDNRIAHVADGETVIPMEVFEQDPGLKEALFERMREMGIEPERYVVGNELNSINPVTGQPEFFLKKLFKGIKKAVKGVVKVFKKIAPIVLSVGLNFLFPGLGAIAAGALGSGIGTLIQGGSLKDALKGALIGGAVAGIGSGIGSVMQGGTFMQGVEGALPGGTPITPGAPDTAAAGKTPPAPEAAGPEIMPPKPGADAVLKEAAGTPPGATSKDVLMSASTGPMEEVLVTAPRLPDPTAGNYLLGPGAAGAAGAQTPTTPEAAPDTAAAGKTPPALEERTFFEKTQDYLVRGGASPQEIAERQLDAYNTAFKAAMAKDIPEEIAKKLAMEAYEKAGVGMLAKYGPMTALGLGIAGAAGAFKPQEMPEPYDFFGGMTRDDYIRMYPERYGYTPIGRDAQGGLLPSRPGYAKDGGDISHFPRKNGPISGPGTETSDDIPAMLSDGEFVMTARAVRGAGNGSRENGMKKMYQMMKTFEGRAARG